MGASREEYDQLIKSYLKHIDTVEKMLFIVAMKFLEEYSHDRDVEIVKMLELLIRKKGREFFS